MQPNLDIDLRAFARDHLALVAATATAVALLCGVAYYQGSLGSLGFQGLVFSLAPETYLTTGGVAFVSSLAGQLVLAVPVAALLSYRSRRRDAQKRRRLTKFADRLSPWRLPLAIFAIAALLPVPWTWIALPSGFDETLFVTGLLVLGAVTALGAVASMSRNERLAFVVVMGLVLAPTLARSAGIERAERMLEEPTEFTRINVWEDRNQSTPRTYLLVHHDAPYYYVLEIFGGEENGRATRSFRPEVIAPVDVFRIDFVPPDAVEARMRKVAAEAAG